MEHEPQVVENGHGESKMEWQTRVHRESLNRLQGSDPVVGGRVTEQHEIIQPARTVAQDGTLSWNSGSLHVGPSGPPFGEELARVAGVSGPGLERSTIEHPHSNVRPAPTNCGEGNWNMSGILGYHDGRKR